MFERLRGQFAAHIMIALSTAQLGVAWGHEGHEVVALIAEHYMTGAALARTNDLLGGAGIDSVASWATITGTVIRKPDRALHRHSASGFHDRHGARVPERPA
jgi:hypothetical protein